MEPERVASESSWSSFNSAMATDESELLAQYLGISTLSNQLEHEPSMLMKPSFWPDNGTDPYYGSQDISSNMYYRTMEKISEYESYYNILESNMMSATGMKSEPALSYTVDGKISMNDYENLGAIKKSKGKRKSQVCDHGFGSINIESSSKKKKIRASLQAGKAKKVDMNVEVGEEGDNSSGPIVQSSSSHISEDEANTSQEFNSVNGSMVPHNSNGKMRACRGSATDPQSLYARKRRERINERLKILQNLVPNGTKVDISTMLEEAVEYVKFLQVQIKLLSSDELWMYAPIVYNGMSIGLDLKISPSLKIG